MLVAGGRCSRWCEASNAGGRGVAFGRNIWQSLDLAKMVGALRHLIHDDGSLQQAALLLR
jgi:DhnA family fructose-bisphosphate aldolase class Ia